MSDHDDLYNKLAANDGPKFAVDLRKVSSMTLPSLSTSELKNLVDLSEIPGECVKLDLIDHDEFSVRKHLKDWKDMIESSSSPTSERKPSDEILELYVAEINDPSIDFSIPSEEIEMSIKFDENYSTILDASDDLDNEEEEKEFQEFLAGMDKALEEDESVGQEEHSEVLDAINSVIFGSDEE